MASKEKKLGRVVVVMGGTSAERREVSLMSGSGVLKALRDARVDAEVFDPQVQDIEELVSKDYDRGLPHSSRKGRGRWRDPRFNGIYQAPLYRKRRVCFCYQH